MPWYATQHYNVVTMSAMESQITSLTIVYSTVYLRHRSQKTSKLRVTGLCEGNSPVTAEFPAQKASNAENVSIWWRHHEWYDKCSPVPWETKPRSRSPVCFVFATIGHRFQRTIFVRRKQPPSSGLLLVWPWNGLHSGSIRREGGLNIQWNRRSVFCVWFPTNTWLGHG